MHRGPPQKHLRAGRECRLEGGLTEDRIAEGIENIGDTEGYMGMTDMA